MLFKSCLHEPISRGEITATVRIWLTPRVRVGGRYRLGTGSVEVQRIQEIGFEALTPALARRCGFASLVEMLKVAKHGAGERVFLIDFRYVDAPPPARGASPARKQHGKPVAGSLTGRRAPRSRSSKRR